MVLIKRTLDNGSNGDRSPPVPRAPRSIRKRNMHQKLVEGCTQFCAFDLLATVAEKLLEESECSSAASSAGVGFDQYVISKDGIKTEPLEGEHDDQGSSEGQGSVYFAGVQKGSCKEKLNAVNDGTGGERVSVIMSSVCSEKVDPDSKLASQKKSNDTVKHTSKIQDFPFGGESDDNNVGDDLNRKLDIKKVSSEDLNLGNKSAIPTNSGEIPISSDSVPKDSFLKHVNCVKLGSEDDDEILSRCSQPNNMKILRSPIRIGDRRFRKTQASQHCKTASKLKDCEVTNSVSASAAGALKHIDNSKGLCDEIDRSELNTPFKKRKLFDRSSIVTYDGGISFESVSNSPDKNRDADKIILAGNQHEGNGKVTAGFRCQSSFNSRNSHVRLGIKSFKVPELFIEVLESTTIGSLKRTVLEAVTSFLGGGLRVGVLLHGKKTRDDNKTLLQTGISQNDDMDTIGFMLEPISPTKPSPLICHKDQHAPVLCDSPKLGNRSQINLKEDMFLLGSIDKPSVTDSNSPAGSSRYLVSSSSMEFSKKEIYDYKSLVPVPEASMEPLAVLPVNQRSKHSEIGQRRTRRPFSVSEVEALVHAVETLGTGRWRDVKLCSFENAKHRTYVDLKDKWKTLVHTARISPQQRRGEPVPQELLDRVLAAQAYWSEHQAKQHGKIPKLNDSVA